MIKAKKNSSKRTLKSKIQRFIRGYSDEDVWAMDYWFLEIVPKMLRQLRDNSMGRPTKFKTSGEWHNELNKIIYYFEQANPDTMIEENEYASDEKFAAQKFLEREYELNKKRDEMKNKGLDLFKEYFWELWD